MATQKAQPATPANATTTAPAPDAAAGTETTKVKKEKLFGGSSSFQEMRKKQGAIDAEFNRAGKAVKKIGLSAETEKVIMEALTAEHAKRSAEVFTSKPEAATAGAESFV